jgi:hypothetical protein
MVLCIVLLHAACAYAPSLPWWHAQDAKHLFFDVTLLFMDTFALSVLFFIAGVFAKPSYDRHGFSKFLKGKLHRLGWPVVLLAALYMPPMVYLGYLRRTPSPEPFFSYWLHWMSFLTDWKFVTFTSAESAATYIDSISPHPLWFMSMLLIFFLFYALVRRMRPSDAPNDTTNGSPWLVLLLAGLCMVLGFALVNTQFQTQSWSRLGPFILFQPTRVPLYATAFVLGVILRPRVRTDDFPGPFWMWGVVFVLSFMVMLPASNSLMRYPGPAPLPMALLHGLLRALLALSAIGLFLRLGQRILKVPSGWRDSLAASSYDIYILHMPLVVFAQSAMVGLAWPIGLKMILAFLFPTALCWTWSRATARRPLWISLAALAAYFTFFVCLF